ncbi:MAG: archease [Dehalococcoidales bacterium]|nr:archease [Dehalococcoidales bacterium]
MKRYELIEHTADLGLKAYGKNLSEAFANAAFGMFSVIAELDAVKEVESRRVEIEEDDAESLLFEWLNSLLYYFDVETLIFKRFDILEFGEGKLRADCRGEKYDPARHRLKTGVKSATYHMLEVDKEKNRVQVIFDV